MDFHPPALFVTSSTTGDLSAAPSRGYAKLLVIQPQTCLSSFGKNSLGLDLSMESITRYQTKPDSMYTFLCAQEFRRDEFANHFKNVHSDIHGGLNGWLEQRCPLAPYGCTYSQRRFYPGVHGAKIIHSQKLESFGLRMDGATKEQQAAADAASAVDVDVDAVDVDCVNGQGSEGEIHFDYLSRLPFELLQYLFRFLDSFSMNNAAMASKLLRQVCSSLLEERGMVVLLWEKHPTGWQISYKTWLYSTSFTPVHSWGFEDYAPIGQHLRTCPYNIRCSYPDKVQVMGKEAASRKRKPSTAEKEMSNGQAEQEMSNGHQLSDSDSDLNNGQ
ncbi:putative F-box only protein 30-like [Apostichopus japonicus]|uniref:Putative F-box only protein 30-like n=1 Tax=Stichopus japonicus TaxID=307972 RepID=A0A2G8JKZ6_STIJA|nr:putative F-box only protein 30-like [Apostichopus japonicus]